MAVARLDGVLDHAENRRVVGIVEIIQLGVLPVNGQGVLGQIIGAQGEELHLLGQFVRHHHGGGSFHHDANLHVSIGDAPLLELRLALLQNLLGVPDLPDGNDHREHNGHGSKGAGPENGPKLRLENFLSGQADADGPVAQSGIFLFIQFEVVRLFVRADVQGADDNLLSGHGLHNPLVQHELLVLAGVVLGVQVDELAAEKADTLGVVLEHQSHVPGVSNVSVDLDFSAIQGDVGLFLQTLEQGLLFEVVGPFLLHGGKELLGGVNVHTVVIAVQHRQFAVPVVLEIHAHQGRNIHGPGQDGSVAVGRTVPGDEAQELTFVQLDRLAGGQIVRHQNGGLVIHHLRVPHAKEHVDHPAGDVLHIGGPGPHILVLHGREGGGKVFPGGGHGVFRSGPLGFDDPLHRVQIVLVVQHHLVDFENGGVVLPHLVQSLVVKSPQLLLGLDPGGVKTGVLLSGSEGGGDGGLGLYLFIDAQGADGDAV